MRASANTVFFVIKISPKGCEGAFRRVSCNGLIHCAIFIVRCCGLQRPSATKFVNFITVLMGSKVRLREHAHRNRFRPKSVKGPTGCNGLWAPLLDDQVS